MFKHNQHPILHLLILIFMLICYICGCSDSLSPDYETPVAVSVNCLLSMDEEVQYLSLIRTLPEYSNSIPYVYDASVEINGISFEPIPRDSVNDYRDCMNWQTTELKLTYGQTCSLTIHWQGNLITGMTQIPESVSPVSTSGSVVEWQGQTNSVYYDFEVPGYWREKQVKSTSLDFKEIYYRYEPGEYDVIIYKYDNNYFEYVYSTYNDSEKLSFGLTGSYGVFASKSAWEGYLIFK